MAQEPLATRGNYLHIYDFRVMKGKEDEFIRLFEEFDYSDGNPMHKSSAQVKDGVLCRDTEDPQRFFLIAEWADIDEHSRPSTSLRWLALQDVDARDKRGHDELDSAATV
jgi:hypothetical protein